jgi:uncharacterized protein YecT (DUF1311 family)
MIRELVLTTLFLSQVSNADDCMDTAMTQRDINVCAYQHSQAAEVLLNKLESEILSVLDAEAKNKFLTSQDAWKIVVSNDCDIESGFFAGGSIEPTIYSSCREKYAKQRILQIRYFLCPEWSMTGVCEAESQYEVSL